MSEQTIKGITKIAVKGFKSIAEECEIDIRPLTILAGANSSGKSSIMQPLLMLKQTLEAPFDPGPLKIDGPNVQFTEAEQFLSTLPNEKRIDSFQVRVETHKSNVFNAVRTTFKKGKNGIEIVEMTKENSGPDQTLSPKFLTLYPEMLPEEIKSLGNQDPAFKNFDIVKRSRCFLYLGSQYGSGFYEVTYGFGADIFRTIHLPGLRGNPERIYKLTSTGPRYPGTFENYIASILHEWHETKDKRLKTVADALHTLGLTGKVGTKKIGDVGIELQVGRLPHDRTDEVDTVNITDVGLGVSQVLPVLVALIAAEPGRLVYIEQPELHLHPRAQVALAQVLADAAKRGVRVVAETHSSLLLLGVQTLVAEGDLSPELVKLHWFTRREDGITEVDSVDLDEAGTYGEWPIDFDDVSLNVQSRFLDAVDSVRFGDKEAS
ncbi:MAG: AAA family ATPase [Candidatus Poribacteria bacterium]|nr:AAA family ATPase [Candidatus Poribacteria bacterium]